LAAEICSVLLSYWSNSSAREHILRWIGIVLQEKTRAQVFRVGGDELASLLSGGTHADQAGLEHLPTFEQIVLRIK
jgi:hypothetical protein